MYIYASAENKLRNSYNKWKKIMIIAEVDLHYFSLEQIDEKLLMNYVQGTAGSVLYF